MFSSIKDLEKIEVWFFFNLAIDVIIVDLLSRIGSYEVYFVIGKLVVFKRSIENLIIDIFDLFNGIYLFRVFSFNGIIIQKFIKE